MEKLNEQKTFSSLSTPKAFHITYWSLLNKSFFLLFSPKQYYICNTFRWCLHSCYWYHYTFHVRKIAYLCRSVCTVCITTPSHNKTCFSGGSEIWKKISFYFVFYYSVQWTNHTFFKKHLANGEFFLKSFLFFFYQLPSANHCIQVF